MNSTSDITDMQTTQEVKSRPILFSTEMVKAILEGRKCQTRRIVKNQSDCNPLFAGHEWEVKEFFARCPYGKVGDILWVRETWCSETIINLKKGLITEYYYKADGDPNETKFYDKVKWKPSIHMPRKACRLFLEITDIRVERLQDISINDAVSEGIKYTYPAYKNYLGGDDFEDLAYFSGGSLNLKNAPAEKASFASLWASINGKESWESNPFVWVISFKRTGGVQ